MAPEAGFEDPGHPHPVTDPEEIRALTQPNDLAYDLVAEDYGEFGGWSSSFDFVQLGVAHARRFHLDQKLAWTGFGVGEYQPGTGAHTSV